MKVKKLLVWPVVLFCLVMTTGISVPFTSESDVLTQASRALNQIAKKATPAVVSITAIKNSGLQPKGTNIPPELSDQLTLGVGSGVIVRSDGLILTNYHVVQNAEKVTVLLDEKHKVSAKILGGDPKTDLAVVKITSPPKTPLPVLGFGNSDQLSVGDWILAVGSPYGLSRSVTSGIVSAVGRGQLGMLDIEDFIQTDAAINPGNSGGPLLNATGEMIGVNTAIFSQSGGFSGIGFAIPSRIAKQVLDEIINHGRVVRGWIGMAAQDLDEDLSKYFKVSPDTGALVSEIQSDGPAQEANLKSGDVIVKYGENSVHSASQLKSLVASTRGSTEIPVKIMRNGSPMVVTVTIREQPGNKALPVTQQAGQVAVGKPTPGHLGVVVQDITAEFSKLLRIPMKTGAIIAEVKPGSPAFDAGLSAGDVILSANRREVHNAKEFLSVMKQDKNQDITVLYVQRGPEEKVFVPIRVS